MGISNFVQYFVRCREWELETSFNIPWRIWNGNIKLGSVFRGG
jgi:hypothetical protein